MKPNYKFYFILGSLLASAMVLYGMKYPAPLYSPGDLVKAHQKTRCGDCHRPFKKVPSESCSTANCHEPGSVGKKDSIKDLHEKIKDQDCLICHTDHKGVSAKITFKFDHRELPANARCVDCHQREGDKAHQGKYGNSCRDCHSTKAWKPASFSHEKAAATPCVECHRAVGEKAHQDKYGNACRDCHSTKAWKPASFSHEKAAAIPCVDCHRAAGEKAHKDKYGDACKDCHNTQDWKKVSFSHDKVASTPCVECHKGPSDDLHRSSGSNCTACHTTKAWKPATLDHDRYFPLEKDHKVACSKCHETQNYKVYTCMNCHVHATRGIIGEHQEEGIRNFQDCLRCHRVYMKGRTYGTDKTGENESMMDDDEYKYRRGGKHDDDDDDEHDRKKFYKRWFDDD